MKRLPSDKFDLRPLRQADDAMPLSEILVDGKPSGVIIAGATLESAHAWDGCYLVFVSDDVPTEETLRIYLLRSDLTVLDSATLGAIYSTGSFSDFRILAPDTVGFRFFGDTSWSLTLRPGGVLTLPFFANPKGVRRPFSFRRYFLLSGAPKPDA